MKVIFLSYDGLMDPLGRSQILPYLENLRPHVDQMQIISFEKHHNINSDYLNKLSKKLSDRKIQWKYQTFTESNFLLFKIFDVLKFYRSFIFQCIRFKPTLVHARGHPMAMFAYSLKRFYKFRLLFDYRGMWPDEKIAKGSWRTSSFIDRLQYKFFKSQELRLLKNSDHIIFLTNIIKKHFANNNNEINNRSSVIPCASDYSFFRPSNKKINKGNMLENQDFNNRIILGYLGSIGPLYDFDGYLDLLKLGLSNGVNIRGLVITNNLENAKENINIRSDYQLNQYIHCMSISREEIPKYLELFDFLISFCTISDSIIGASPTKIGEALSLGIPIISNSGVGDTDAIIKKCDSGIIIQDTSIKSLKNCLEQIKTFKANKFFIRETSKMFFDLNAASVKYQKVYKKLNMDD